MTVKTQILDGGGSSKRANVHNYYDTHENLAALLTFQERYLRFEPGLLPFISADYGVAMNQNAAFGGTPELIHDGTDTVAWTGTSIVGGKVNFARTDRPLNGTKSVRVDNPNLNDIWQFGRGSDMSVANFSALTMYLNVDKDWTTGDSVSVFGYDTGLASMVGNTVLLENYFNPLTFDVWQVASIPLADMGLTSGTIDAIRMQQVGRAGKAGRFFIDDFNAQQSGGAIEFRATTPVGTAFHISELLFSFADNVTSAVSNGTMMGLSYDSLLGVSALTNGISLQRVEDGETEFSLTLTQLSDFLDSGMVVTNALSDGTNTYINLALKFQDSFIMRGNTEENYISVSVNDDLSGLLQFTGSVLGGVEV